jgi:Phosphatidylinositol-specific phospholipase C, Y domain/Phosphatidylinositol-specific phospholipase C, X domain/C2 domain
VCNRTITFQNVLRVIKRYAFVASPFPVIISIESHLSEEMQRIAADNIKNELGESLFILSSNNLDLLPSPEELRGKILIKAKKGQWGHHAGSTDEPDIEDDAESNGDDEERADIPEEVEQSEELNQPCEGTDVEKFTPSGKGRAVSVIGRARSLFSRMKLNMKSKDDRLKRKPSSRKKTPGIVAKELADVTSFAGGSRQKLLASWAAGRAHPSGQPASDIVSLGELKILESFASGLWKMLLEHNERNLTRVYPKAARVDSGNYNPMPAWQSGCQLVALNWQSPNLATWLNSGRFAVNGNCGYALKKPRMLPGGVSGSGELEVHILSGFLLPHHKSRLRGSEFADYYVDVSIAGCSREGLPTIRNKTTLVIKDGFSPSWRERIRLSVEDAEFELLLLRVYDKDRASRDGLVGFCCCPVYALRTGVRACHLTAEDGSPLFVPGSSCLLPTVLCEIAWHPEKSREHHGQVQR